jgi:hypothetical protein
VKPGYLNIEVWFNDIKFGDTQVKVAWKSINEREFPSKTHYFETLPPSYSKAVVIEQRNKESYGLKTTASEIHAYIESLIDDLFAAASEVQPDPKVLRKVSTILPELLENFALRLGRERPSKEGRELMFRVHECRR